MIRSIFIMLLFSFSINAQAQFNFKPSDEGSKIHFIIKNFGINTGGDLKGLSGSIEIDPYHLDKAVFNVSVEAKTIDTDNKMRDDHLRSGSYFDAEKFPLITIRSTRINLPKDKKTQAYYFTGTLTMHGVTKNVSFPFTTSSKGKDQLFTGSFQINRSDFGIGSSGGVMGSTVKISLSVLAKKV